MAFWNSKVLAAPPTLSCKGYINYTELKNVRITLSEGIKFFKEEQLMFAESAVLSRIIYRLKTKFRSSKDLHSLVKLQHALKNYFSVNLTTSLKNFLNLLPRRVQDENNFLPTRNMLDYILVRLQGLVKLIERIFNTAKIAAYELKQRINTGNFWKIAIIVLAVASRVLVLARHTAKCLCELYDKIIPFRSKFNNTSTDWIPQDYTLPINLKDWLNVDWIDEEYESEVPSQKLRIVDFFDLVGPDEDDDVQFCDEYVLVDDDQEVEFIQEFKNVMKKQPKLQFTDNLLRGFSVEEDIGEILDVEDISIRKRLEPEVLEINTKDNIEVSSSDSSDVGIQIEESGIGNIYYIRDSSLKQTKEAERLENSKVILLETPKKLPDVFQERQKQVSDSVISIQDDESVISINSNVSDDKPNKYGKREFNAARDNIGIINLDSTNNISFKYKKNKKRKRKPTITETDPSQDVIDKDDDTISSSLDVSSVSVKKRKNKKQKLNTLNKAAQNETRKSESDNTIKTNKCESVAVLCDESFSARTLNKSKKLKRKKSKKKSQNSNESVILVKNRTSESDSTNIKIKKNKKSKKSKSDIMQVESLKDSRSIVSILSDSDTFFSKAASKVKKSKKRGSVNSTSSGLLIDNSLQSRGKNKKNKKKQGKPKVSPKKLSKNQIKSPNKSKILSIKK